MRWLAVPFPEVDPELTVALLQHVVEETPDDSDGGPLAATVAQYIVDLLGTEGGLRDNRFYSRKLPGVTDWATAGITPVRTSASTRADTRRPPLRCLENSVM